LAKSVGFEIVNSQTPGVLDVDIVHERFLDQGKERLAVDPFIQLIVGNSDEKLRENFQKFLSGNGLSSNMLMICRRPA
jgi:hypothetical protein